MAPTILAFLAVSSLVVLLWVLLTGRNQRVADRIRELSGERRADPGKVPVAEFARSMLPRLGEVVMPRSEKDLGQLQARLIHAGYYNRSALGLFLGVKMTLILLPIALGGLAAAAQLCPLTMGLLYGLIGGTIGMLAPGLWLDYRKSKRQSKIRRSLPDALDIIGICLEGGLSLQAAMQRVADELGTVHPLLASEMRIAQRTTKLGRSTGEAFREFADRCDLEEIRSLASVLLQAERLGASMASTLRTHSDTLRAQRLERAEEMAHKAATKMVFPTVLFIFPAILLVMAGPAVIQVYELLLNMGSTPR